MTLAWDTTAPLHAARADRCEVLHASAGTERRHVATSSVVAELAEAGVTPPGWLETVDQGDDPELAIAYLVSFARWQTRLGSDPAAGHDIGEADTLAWSETFGAIALIDDQDARTAARTALPPDASWCVHGSLWAISRDVVEQRSTPQGLSGFCDAMLRTGIRWPFQMGDYPRWFARNRKQLDTTCCQP